MGRWVVALRLIGMGFFVGVSILLGVVAGLWLDGRFNTSPVLVLVGLILGITIAFYGVYHMLLPFIGKKQEKENR